MKTEMAILYLMAGCMWFLLDFGCLLGVFHFHQQGDLPRAVAAAIAACCCYLLGEKCGECAMRIYRG